MGIVAAIAVAATRERARCADRRGGLQSHVQPVLHGGSGVILRPFRPPAPVFTLSSRRVLIRGAAPDTVAMRRRVTADSRTITGQTPIRPRRIVTRIVQLSSFAPPTEPRLAAAPISIRCNQCNRPPRRRKRLLAKTPSTVSSRPRGARPSADGHGIETGHRERCDHS